MLSIKYSVKCLLEGGVSEKTIRGNAKDKLLTLIGGTVEVALNKN